MHAVSAAVLPPAHSQEGAKRSALEVNQFCTLFPAGHMTQAMALLLQQGAIYSGRRGGLLLINAENIIKNSFPAEIVVNLSRILIYENSVSSRVRIDGQGIPIPFAVTYISLTQSPLC